MVRGIYSSARGMMAESKKINVLGNNVSNVNTVGYKRTDVTISTFSNELLMRTSDDASLGSIADGVGLLRESTDLSAGNYSQTGADTDLAIVGNGFFAVQGTDGVTKYTRAGDFSVDPQGFLALPTGERLLGANGQPLNVGGDKFSVSPDGTVTTANGQAGNIAIYNAANTQAITQRRDGFFDIAGAQAAGGMIKQGWLEGSNTDTISEMTGLMQATRSFQGCQQAFEVSDEAYGKLVSQVGSIK